jgi:HlyD family secretion protein
VQLKKVSLLAPTDGVILTRSIEPGEFASAGATLFVIGRLDNLEITVYLPEEKYPLVNPGEEAQVRVDAYPQRTFTATVLRIADKAEFTPRNVQTVEGRKDTVFAVRLSISNPDLALKPGLPADVTFGVQ